MIILHFIEIKTLNTLILEENALVLWFYGKKNLFIYISLKSFSIVMHKTLNFDSNCRALIIGASGGIGSSLPAAIDRLYGTNDIVEISRSTENLSASEREDRHVDSQVPENRHRHRRNPQCPDSLRKNPPNGIPGSIQ